MIIDTSSALSFSTNQPTTHKSNNSSFSKHLLDTIASQNTKNTSDDSNSLLAEVKEKGILTYIQEKRDAEIREKVLQALGATEEELAAMPHEQRAKMEGRIAEAIAEEIEKRQAVTAELSDDTDSNSLRPFQRF